MEFICGPVKSGTIKSLINFWRKDPLGILVTTENDINTLIERYNLTDMERVRTISCELLIARIKRDHQMPSHLYIENIDLFMKELFKKHILK